MENKKEIEKKKFNKLFSVENFENKLQNAVFKRKIRTI